MDHAKFEQALSRLGHCQGSLEDQRRARESSVDARLRHLGSQAARSRSTDDSLQHEIQQRVLAAFTCLQDEVITKANFAETSFFKLKNFTTDSLLALQAINAAAHSPPKLPSKESLGSRRGLAVKTRNQTFEHRCQILQSIRQGSKAVRLQISCLKSKRAAWAQKAACTANSQLGSMRQQLQDAKRREQQSQQTALQQIQEVQMELSVLLREERGERERRLLDLLSVLEPLSFYRN